MVPGTAAGSIAGPSESQSINTSTGTRTNLQSVLNRVDWDVHPHRGCHCLQHFKKDSPLDSLLPAFSVGVPSTSQPEIVTEATTSVQPTPPPAAVLQQVQLVAAGVTPLSGTVVINNPSAPQTLTPLVLANPLTQTVVTQALNQSPEMAAILSTLNALAQAQAVQGAQIVALHQHPGTTYHCASNSSPTYSNDIHPWHWRCAHHATSTSTHHCLSMGCWSRQPSIH